MNRSTISQLRAELANARAHERGLVETIARLRAELSAARCETQFTCDECGATRSEGTEFAAMNQCAACAAKLPANHDAELYAAATAMAEAYSVDTLRDFAKALDTAMDDSYHFAKDSDDDGEEREQESDSLAMLARLVSLALEGTEEGTR